VSLHFDVHAEHYCEPVHWIYTVDDIRYGLFQRRLWSCRFRETQDKRWNHDFLGLLLSRPGSIFSFHLGVYLALTACRHAQFPDMKSE
jgi:hypothetical protein